MGIDIHKEKAQAGEFHSKIAKAFFCSAKL